MDAGVYVWWIAISSISVFNIGAWIYSFVHLTGKKDSMDPLVYSWRRWILWLSGVYVLVCAFRSFLPRIDLERICLLETYWSSMFVGRTAATIAELCFVIQCSILLREAGITTRVKIVNIVFWVLVPMIVIAEGFSWYAILTTNYLGSVVEESLWAVAGVLVLISFYALWSRFDKLQRYFIAVMMAYAIGFIVFMVTVDVPMYWTRWQADVTSGVTYLSLAEGIRDASRLCKVSFGWDIWRQEIPWMTLYFSVTVWVSIAMAHAPGFRRTPP